MGREVNVYTSDITAPPTNRWRLIKNFYFEGSRWAMWLAWSLPLALIGGYDLGVGQGFLPSTWPKLGEVLPTWVYWAWGLVGVLLLAIVTFERSYRHTKKIQAKIAPRLHVGLTSRQGGPDDCAYEWFLEVRNTGVEEVTRCEAHLEDVATVAPSDSLEDFPRTLLHWQQHRDNRPDFNINGGSQANLLFLYYGTDSRRTLTLAYHAAKEPADARQFRNRFPLPCKPVLLRLNITCRECIPICVIIRMNLEQFLGKPDREIGNIDVTSLFAILHASPERRELSEFQEPAPEVTRHEY